VVGNSTEACYLAVLNPKPACLQQAEGGFTIQNYEINAHCEEYQLRDCFTAFL